MGSAEHAPFVQTGLAVRSVHAPFAVAPRATEQAMHGAALYAPWFGSPTPAPHCQLQQNPSMQASLMHSSPFVQGAPRGNVVTLTCNTNSSSWALAGPRVRQE